MKPNYIVLTRRDGTEEILRKSFIKRIVKPAEQAYTFVTIHGSAPTGDCTLQVQESPTDILLELDGLNDSIT